MTRTSHPQISFADLEFLRQGTQLDPILQAISQFIDRHPRLVESVRRDLVRGLKRPDTGKACRKAGVTIVCIPQRGGRKTPEREAYEKTAAFKRGTRPARYRKTH